VLFAVAELLVILSPVNNVCAKIRPTPAVLYVCTVKHLLLGMRPYSSNLVTHADDVAPFNRYTFFDYSKPGKKYSVVRHFTK